MDISPEVGKKIQELQLLEQTLQNFLMQKQTLQVELNEINNALNELSKSEDEVYRIIGGIMLRSNKKDLSSDLTEQKKIAELRLQSIEKQEKISEDKSTKLRNEISESMKKKN
jgi:prefoldin beta subunit